MIELWGFKEGNYLQDSLNGFSVPNFILLKLMTGCLIYLSFWGSSYFSESVGVPMTGNLSPIGDQRLNLWRTYS